LRQSELSPTRLEAQEGGQEAVFRGRRHRPLIFPA
jgi:hypothetical protein